MWEKFEMWKLARLEKAFHAVRAGMDEAAMRLEEGEPSSVVLVGRTVPRLWFAALAYGALLVTVAAVTFLLRVRFGDLPFLPLIPLAAGAAVPFVYRHVTRRQCAECYYHARFHVLRDKGHAQEAKLGIA